MDVKEFGKYIIDNMHRATLGNALNIVDKLDINNNDNTKYNVNELLSSMSSYASDLVGSGLSIEKAHKILVVVDTYYSKYNDDTIKYNKMMIADDFIIGIWESINGK